MFGIELTTLQKLEVAFICVILGVAGVFIFRSVQPSFDTNINTFKLTRQHPINDNASHSLPVSATNPRDPKKEETVTVIAVADGQLEISQFLNDPARHLAFLWKPERRHPGQVYKFYQDPLAPVDRIKDPFKHALAFATYKMVYEVPNGLGLLRNAGMTGEQPTQEADARDLMKKEILIINAGVDGGTYRSDLLDKVSQAMAAYDAKPGDPRMDKSKADLARRLLDAVGTYLGAVHADKDKSIDKYIAVMDKLLTAEQKQKFVDGYKAYTQPARPASRGRGTVGTFPARGGTTNPARGGTTGPARGRGTTAPIGA
jgi:hypothetical protein